MTLPLWRKSSHSGTEGNCVEVALIWRKSSHSGGENECVEVMAGWDKSSYSGSGGNCVEAAVMGSDQATAPHKTEPGRFIVMRDSKNPDGPWLYVPPAAWDAFRLGLRAGQLDSRR
ncbi:DUF397 domain-containing protein [Sphaerisporangium album]|uniref:DUF397 domain-containing protein n=1 Tax=Sphaerisporangium album TaxID=509200 RepID=A0A367FUU7_9ACTN|nr:DUF397 domain-containing protein [Sphaerisporangium album]RCG33375.1 DUF397 domain-containing protein [Sphaerisporangium album]